MENIFWEKLGQIFKVNNNNSYLFSHASNPLAIHLENDVFRIFYSGRSKENKSSVGYVDINIITLEVIEYPKEPVLCYGDLDSFYSHGISIGNSYIQENNEIILFMGWQIPPGNHWRGDIGRIVLSKDKKNMEVNPICPFMGVDEEDKISLSYPFVIFHDNLYKMWYGSTISWDSSNGEMIHVIKYATSVDGENWIKKGIAIPFELGIAQAFSRPTVLIDENGYHMWYSYRDGTGTKYRIGYSKSIDGVVWENKIQDVGISTSDSGWDSEMICYPFVFDHKGERYMLYNGNEFGRFGFGIAKLMKGN